MRKPVKGYEGYYEIDHDGNIYSLDREYVNSLGRKCKVRGIKLSPIKHGTGYCVVGLTNGIRVKTHRWHRVVAENLISNPNNYPVVNHLDGNKRNNHPSNLEWVTQEENEKHAVKTGLKSSKGVNNPATKFSFEDVSDWYLLILGGIKIKDIATLYGCERNTIRRLIIAEFGQVLDKYKGNCRRCKL